MIRALLIDDEPPGREKIARHLAAYPDIAIVGECGDGDSAVNAIVKTQPDLVFLDIQLPECDAFEVLRRTAGDASPAVIFVTAYDHYALKAFEVHALDYLVKPFDDERFDSAVGRAREQITQIRQAAQKGVAAPRHASLKDRILVQNGGKIRILRSDEIDWIEAAGNYVQLHCGRDTYLYRQTMNRLESWLDAERFLRIHRSTIVNIDRVKELHPLFKGAFTVVLHDGTELTMSPVYRSRWNL